MLGLDVGRRAEGARLTASSVRDGDDCGLWAMTTMGALRMRLFVELCGSRAAIAWTSAQSEHSGGERIEGALVLGY